MKGCCDMTRNEFEKKWDKNLLEVLGFIIGEKALVPCSINCYKDGNEWIIRDIDERQDVYERLRGDEETVFNKIDGMAQRYYKREKENGRL